MKKWIDMAQEAIEWLKTIAMQLDATNVLLQELVAGQQRAETQRMVISDIYVKAGEAPSAEKVAAEVARLQRARS